MNKSINPTPPRRIDSEINKLKRTNRLLTTGFGGISVVLVGIIAFMCISPAGADPATGTCLPIDKGGTNCDPGAVRDSMGLGNSVGALDIANGGTGQTTAAGIRSVLGLGNDTGALPVANGGTGASSALGARNNLLLNYSTDEQDTGVKWINGKTIYEKTIVWGALTNNSAWNGDHRNHGIPNVDMPLSIEGFLYLSSTGVGVPIPSISMSGTTFTSAIRAFMTRTQLAVQHFGDLSTYDDSYLTVRYTCTDR